MIINKTEIATKLQKLKSTIPAKAQLQVLKGVLLKDNTLYADNYELAMSVKLDVETDEEFIIPKEAIEMIINLPQGDVDIKADTEDIISISIGEIKNKYKTLRSNDFPKQEDKVFDIAQSKVDGKAFINALKTVYYAICTDENRKKLCGVLLEADGTDLNIVAVDGFRVSWNKIKCDGKFKIVVPKEGVSKLIGLGCKDEIEIAIGKNSALFKMGEYRVYTMLLEGDFFEYRSVFQHSNNGCIVNRQLLIDSVSRASICLVEKAKPNVKFKIKENSLNVIAKTTFSEYEEVIELETPIDKPVEILFNGRYLQEALNSYDVDHIELEFISAVSPVTATDGNLKSLMLPVREA